MVSTMVSSHPVSQGSLDQSAGLPQRQSHPASIPSAGIPGSILSQSSGSTGSEILREVDGVVMYAPSDGSAFILIPQSTPPDYGVWT